MTLAEVDGALLARIQATAGRVLVAITGVDGSGKTRFADRFADRVREAARPALRVSIDDFHNPRAVRYEKGRRSPEGFFADSFDYRAFRDLVLDPLAPGASGWIVPAAFDHRRDARRAPAPVQVPEDAVLVIDGIFLIRPELAGAFDVTVMLDVPFHETFARMAQRDGCAPDPDAADNRRYKE
ncbi:MAG TPA: uridine kinase, partial [Rhodobacterales bacterium]|nr:uridine kinase [Rhodobacterales bacterium]